MPLSPPPPPHERATNVVLWLVFALASLAVGGYFLGAVYRHLGADLGLGVVGLLGRTAVYVSGGLLVEGLLLRTGARGAGPGRPRRVALHIAWIALMALCVALVADLLVFAFAGYHLTTAIRILFSDGPAGVGQVVEATGLSRGLVLGVAAGVAAGVAVAAFLSRLVRRASCRLGVTVTRRNALRALFVSLGVLAAVEMVSFRVRNPFLWEREVRSVPLAFSIVRPEAELASFRVAPRPPPRPAAAPAPAAVSASRRPDVFIVMIESLRRDAVTPAIMPNLSALAERSWTFEHAITAGNVTHYSWFGLFRSELPVSFDVARAAPDDAGSAPLAALRRLGYRIHLFATPDTEYQGIEALVFGKGGALLDEKVHPPDRLPAARDAAVVEALTRALAARPKGGNVYVLALDSSHFDYAWGPGFEPPFRPYATDASVARSYQRDARAREALENRYRDAVAWVDLLLGRLVAALRASGRLDASCIVVTGDHGEAFWEHGSGTHGTDLSSEQLEVGFVMRLPGRAPRRFEGVFSLLDVMPTLLEELGAPGARALHGVPVQARFPAAGAAPGAAGGAPEPGPGPLAPRAALTFRGWNERTYRFALTSSDRRLLLELDHTDPRRARRLSLKGVTDLRDVSLVDGDGRDPLGSYERVVRDLPAVMDELPFLAL